MVDQKKLVRLRDEAFYIDEHGRKADAAIHDFILDGVDPNHELQQRIESARRSVASGLDPVLAAQAYGLPEGFDIGPGPTEPDPRSPK